jgi:hypothetical protein
MCSGVCRCRRITTTSSRTTLNALTGLPRASEDLTFPIILRVPEPPVCATKLRTKWRNLYFSGQATMAKTAACRAGESLGQASITCANLGSRRKLCVPICVPASASCSGCNVPTSVRALPPEPSHYVLDVQGAALGKGSPKLRLSSKLSSWPL